MKSVFQLIFKESYVFRKQSVYYCFKCFRRHKLSEEFFDVVVVGGGHAACEAALASARAGASTLLLAINLDHRAQMSCNPAIGGIAKGHVVREIDALGGAMGRVTDAASLQFRLLNLRKGPAVWSPRSQCDKVCYQKAMKRELELQENLQLRQGTACSFLLENGRIAGVVSELGEEFHSKAVVLATGTFLHGKMHYGLRNMPGGRAGDPPSIELAEALRDQLHLRMGRLKTGTPPRILGKSIDFSHMETQSSDDVEEHFSFFPEDSVRPRVEHKNVPCHLVYSNQATAEIVRRNLDQAPMYRGVIEGIGARYCPSFEDKVVRFAHHERHLLYIEPEGENTDEYYINGISTSLPPSIQIRMLRTIPGLERVEIARYAYAIEYDFVYPEELSRSLGVKKYPGLFHAGQINGTSGYEEAAGQGLVAGLNAARFAAGLDPVEFGRDEAYIGVMIDDLVTKEIVEPYRLFTSRAEHRLALRQDNADFRLCEKAYSLGLLPQNKYDQFKEYSALCDSAEAACRTQKMHGRTLWDCLKDAQGTVDAANPPFDCSAVGLDCSLYLHRRVLRQLAVRSHYEGYLKREEQSIAKLHSLEAWRIPEEFDYAEIKGLRNESRMKLMKTKPTSLAQAGRIDGVTPSEIALLQVHLMRRRRQAELTEKDEPDV